MAMVKVRINGQNILADSNKTIMQVVHEKGLDHIPNLCFENQLEPYNSCFICVVELAGRNSLVPACSTQIQDGMEIVTNNERVHATRRSALELIVSNHYADCLGPCTLTCPAGVDVQGYIALISMGRYQEAVQLIKQTNPLPAVCGRVCTRPCEVACRRNLLDERVGIDFLKRFAADVDLEESLQHVTLTIDEERDEHIAIIGSGPSGLSAAFYLRQRGYQATIFEAMPEAGGMLRYGIPEYRLPFDILDREIDTILELGVDLRTNMRLGEDFSIRDLLHDGFSSVYLALGAWGSRKLGVPGQDAEGILSGIKFLEDLGAQKKPEISGKIVVVGGGNTAIDCARTSLRLGADQVVLLYRRTRTEMPANEMEIEAAEHEGVDMHFLAAPVEVITENNRVKALKCIQMELGAPDASGRRRPVPMTGSEFILECDFVFAAIGQMPDLQILTGSATEMLPENMTLKMTRWGTVVADEQTCETSIPGVFAGGDMVTGAATVIEGIAAGRKAAHAIDTWLQTGVARNELFHFNSKKDEFGEVQQADLRYDIKQAKQPMPELPAKVRIRTFCEVETGFDVNQAADESSRCLECGCEALFDCRLRQYASEYGVDLKNYKGDVNKYELDRSHPLIELDPNKCILCSRCIRVCNQVAGASVFGFETRGFTTIVRPEMGKPLAATECISCGICEGTCPTGAISLKIQLPKPGPFNTQKTRTTCGFCSVGCSMTVETYGADLVKISPDTHPSRTYGNLCKMGRFGWKYIDDQRALTPWMREDKDVVPADWSTALDTLARVSRKIIDEYRADEIAVFVSPRLTNETAYLTQKFARVILRTNHVGSAASEINNQRDLAGIFSSGDMTDLESTDLVMVAMADLRRDHPVADFMIRRERHRNVKTICVNTEETTFSAEADHFIPIEPQQEVAFYIGILKALDSKLPPVKTTTWKELKQVTGLAKSRFNEIAEELKTAGNVLVISDRDRPGNRDKRALGLLQMMTQKLDGKIILFSESCNSQGLWDMGVSPSWLPGYQSLNDKTAVSRMEKIWRASIHDLPPAQGNMMSRLKQGKYRVAVILGEDIASLGEEYLKSLTNLDILIVGDVFETKTAELADIFFPMSCFAETDGSYTNAMRGISSVRKSLEPAASMENWRIIRDLVSAMGLRYKFDYSDISDVQTEIKMVTGLHGEADFNADWHGTPWPLIAMTGISVFPELPNDLDIHESLLRESCDTRILNSIWTWFDQYWSSLNFNRE